MVMDTGCAEDGCFEWVFSEELAIGLGWSKVGDKLFCASHGPLMELQDRNRERREALEARADAISRRVRDDAAKSGLTTEDYAAWHAFQQDLTKYWREHNKLAPNVLRALTPKDFVAQHKKTGRIDVERFAESMAEAETDKKDWIASRLRMM